MTDFLPALREQLVAAAGRAETRRRPRTGVLVAAATGLAAVVAVLVLVLGALPGADRAADRPTPAPKLAGREFFGGSLEPGVRYRTRALRPPLSFVVGDAEWFAHDATSPLLLSLERRIRPGVDGNPEAPARSFLSFERLPRVYDPRVRGLRASLVRAPADLYGWLRAHPDLRVGGSDPVTVAGVPGQSFRVAVEFRRPAHSDPFCLRTFNRDCTTLGPGSWLLDGQRLRMMVLRTGPDPLVISLIGETATDQRALEAPAARVLASLRIGAR